MPVLLWWDSDGASVHLRLTPGTAASSCLRRRHHLSSITEDEGPIRPPLKPVDQQLFCLFSQLRFSQCLAFSATLTSMRKGRGVTTARGGQGEMDLKVKGAEYSCQSNNSVEILGRTEAGEVPASPLSSELNLCSLAVRQTSLLVWCRRK